MATKILALDGLNDQKLCSLIVHLLQTIPSVKSASIDYLSQKLTLQIKEEQNDIVQTIAEVSLALKENIPGVTIRLTAVGDTPQKPIHPSNNLNFSKERALLKEQEAERLKEEQRLDAEKREDELEAQRLAEETQRRAKEAELLILEQEIQAVKNGEAEARLLEEEAKKAAEALKEPQQKTKKSAVTGEIRNRILVVSAAVALFLLSMALSGFSLFCLLLQLGAFLLLSIQTLLAVLPKNNEGSKLADILVVCAAGTLFFLGGYFSAVTGILLYSVSSICASLIYSDFYNKLSSIIDIKPEKVICTRDGVTELLSPNQVLPNDLVVIDAGQTIPFDGIINDGTSQLDRFLFSGSRLPIAAAVGDEVKCGDVNLEAPLTICVLDLQLASFATRVFGMVTNSPLDNTKTASELRKANTYFTLILFVGVVIGGAFAFDSAGLDGLLNFAPMALLLLLPCGGVASASMCYLSTVGRALKQGIIITTSRNMDMVARAKTVIFGYTGVLTKKEYSFKEIIASEDNNNEEVMEAAAYAESGIVHPIAQKIVEQYTELYKKKVIPSKIGLCDPLPGGVKALVDLRITIVGSGKLMETSTIEVPTNEDGRLNVYVARFGKYIGTVVLEDPVREGLESVAGELRGAGASRVGLLTGCDRAVAQAARKKLQFDSVYAEQTDSDKLATMLNLIEQPDMPVLFIGNEDDSEVFSPLCPSISMGNENLETLLYFSSALIPSNDIKKAVKAVRLSKSARHNAFFNLGAYFTIKVVLLVSALFLGMAFLPAVLINSLLSLLLVVNSASIISRR